jgi:two-component sensor histidine kinase
MLAITQAMIHQTSRRSTSLEEFREVITERIAGLGRSTDLLTLEQWAGVPIKRLLEKHLTTFLATPRQLEMQGDDFEVKAEAVHNLGLVLHELATNAMKYGALSRPAGQLLIAWDIAAADTENPQLILTWRETGGPPSSPPSEKGFGSQIIEKHAAAAFRGKVTLDYGADSFLWKLEAPLKSFVDDGSSDSVADPVL